LVLVDFGRVLGGERGHDDATTRHARRDDARRLIPSELLPWQARYEKTNKVYNINIYIYTYIHTYIYIYREREMVLCICLYVCLYTHIDIISI